MPYHTGLTRLRTHLNTRLMKSRLTRPLRHPFLWSYATINYYDFDYVIAYLDWTEYST
jgi:hypothetical protein